jgi:GNAT superfamily N-acetyltransferase
MAKTFEFLILNFEFPHPLLRALRWMRTGVGWKRNFSPLPKQMGFLEVFLMFLRPAQPGDEGTIFSLICELAEYEKLTDAVTGSAERLAVYLFGSEACVEAVIAEVEGVAVGFALFFRNFSTFLTTPGLYLEDLYVQPAFRGHGIGKALIVHLAQLAVSRGYGRMEWSVLTWNTPAIGFYEYLGAEILEDWRSCRVSGNKLKDLAEKFSESSEQ